MFGNAYVVDTIKDGEQLLDSGIIGFEQSARHEFDRQCLFAKYNIAGEVTVRLIKNGDVLAESTFVTGRTLTDVDNLGAYSAR